jgi:hypothetical protein
MLYRSTDCRSRTGAPVENLAHSASFHSNEKSAPSNPGIKHFGIGQRYHALPWNVLTYDTGKGGYVISATKDQLMSAPHFAAGEEPFARTEDMRRIREFWAEGQLSL